MTKSGILALSLGLGIPTVVVGTTAVTAVCLTKNAEDQGIDPQIKCGGNVFNVTHTKITIGNSFKVRINNDTVGYEKVDADNTEIKIDDKKVDFKVLEDLKTIEVDGKDVTSTNISIKINALATVSQVTYKWNKKFLHLVNWPCYDVGEKMTVAGDTPDLVVEALYGNEQQGEWKQVSPGTGKDQYRLSKTRNNQGLIDITDEVVQNGGYTFTDKDIKVTSAGKRLPYDNVIEINFTSDTFGATGQTHCLVGEPLTSIKFNEETCPKQVKRGESVSYAYSRTVLDPTSAIPYAEYKIEEDTGSTGSNMTIYGLFTAGQNAGKVKIKVWSLKFPEKSGTFEIEVI